MKILIVEDQYISRKFLQRLLTPYGDCTGAINGSLALEKVKSSLESEEPFDLICLDIMLPNMDGHETLLHIRELEKQFKIPPEKQSKILMTTAMADQDNVVRAAESGCQGYLIKPISKERIAEEFSKFGWEIKDDS